MRIKDLSTREIEAIDCIFCRLRAFHNKELSNYEENLTPELEKSLIEENRNRLLVDVQTLIKIIFNIYPLYDWNNENPEWMTTVNETLKEISR